MESCVAFFTEINRLLHYVHTCPCGYSWSSKGTAPAPLLWSAIPKAHLRSLLNRIDIHIEVPRVDYKKLSSNKLDENSETICKQV